MEQVELQWMGQLKFNALVGEQNFNMDAEKDIGGEASAPNPKQMLLASICGCLAMNLAYVMQQRRKPLDNIRIMAKADLAKQHPKVFTNLHLIYEVEGSSSYENDLLKTIAASHSQYCPVSIMIEKAVPLNWEINFNGHLIFNNQASATHDLF